MGPTDKSMLEEEMDNLFDPTKDEEETENTEEEGNDA